MKANKAPEKIYYHKGKLRTPFAVEQKLDETDVEYIRADAFIEKAEKWFRDRFPDTDEKPIIIMICDFREYMKGE